MRVEVEEPAVANTAGDGIRHAPYGVFGGQDGLPHRYRLISQGHTRFLKTKEVGIAVHPGARFFVESSGGGGYGDPALRDPEARAADAANGFVTQRPKARAAEPSPRARRASAG
jgi:N-methylhydantoinase B